MVSVEVHTLTIVSNDLPEVERQQIVREYEGRTIPLEELVERIRQNLRDSGYAEASAEIPQLAAMVSAPPARSVDVTVRVTAGAKYQLDAIRFENASAFTTEQLRSRFPIESGALFNAAAIGRGLDQLRDLYGSKGYINFGAIPKLEFDEARHTVNLTIDVDEGRVFAFGRLFFDGVEPHAGASKELLAAWDSLEGKTYNSRLLADWLATNATFAPETERKLYGCISPHLNPDMSHVDFQLDFPDIRSEPPR